MERRIKNTGKGHDWYGGCERCGKHCSTHYKQQLKTKGGWINSAYGHLECIQEGDYMDATVIHHEKT